MSWQGIRGHDLVVEQFRRSIEQRRLATTFLFVGEEGIGKRTFALKLAQAMLCTETNESDLAPCDHCPSCQQVRSNSHPDLQLVQKPADRAFIPVEVFIGERDQRMRTGLCRFLSLTPSAGSRRIAIIDDADWLNIEGANSLLKTLEEPSPGNIIILISTSVQRQLPTIRSRSQVVRFQPLSDEDVAANLVDLELAASKEQAIEMAARGHGSLSLAVQLSEDAVRAFRNTLWSMLARPQLDRQGITQCVNDFAESAGKENAAKRRQLRMVFDTAIEFYRAVARRGSGDVMLADQDLQACVHAAAENHSGVHDIAVEQAERCFDAISQVNSNANLGVLVDAWAADLAVMARTKRRAATMEVS